LARLHQSLISQDRPDDSHSDSFSVPV